LVRGNNPGDEKAVRNCRIFEMWMACHTQEQIVDFSFSVSLLEIFVCEERIRVFGDATFFSCHPECAQACWASQVSGESPSAIAKQARAFLIDLARGKYNAELKEVEEKLTAIGVPWAIMAREALHAFVTINKAAAPESVQPDGEGGMAPTTNIPSHRQRSLTSPPSPSSPPSAAARRGYSASSSSSGHLKRCWSSGTTSASWNSLQALSTAAVAFCLASAHS
jgi:hypothetical protein